jgi:hypothetical protein
MRHAYPSQALLPDFLRGSAGLLMTLLPLALLPLHWAVALLLAAGALLFAAFSVRTLQRRLTVLVSGDEGIASEGPLVPSMGWGDLRDLKLSYYSTRRDRNRGWMQLTLKGRGRSLAVESTITGFDHLVERAAMAAVANRLALSTSTMNNLASLGIEQPAPGGEKEDGASWVAHLSAEGGRPEAGAR